VERAAGADHPGRGFRLPPRRVVPLRAGGRRGVEHAFRGTFHSVRENAFILQTFEYEGYPDVLTLEYSTFEDLPGGRSRLVGRSVYPDLEAREKYLANGMESGMAAGYEQLEDLLA
jgi:uncharacterized protein YndB with AHSA1/START domain